MTRLYIAGAISDPSLITALDNIRRGARLSAEALLAGFAVFSPFIDFQLFLALRDGESIPKPVIQAQSMAWLDVSDAVLLVPGWENSGGTRREIERAEQLGIPVFVNLDGVMLWDAAREKDKVSKV